jgi:nucleotide-binding universal stress UspA family protein/nitrite reductase/ring-hydroxylating ferredoxin subunit
MRSLIEHPGYRDGPHEEDGTGMAYKRILFGTDGSASAQAAGAVASALSKAESAQLIVGFAFERATDAEQIVSTAVAQAEAAGVRHVSGEARAGVPADALISLADGHDVGLVVVSGGRGKKYGLGQVAHRLAVRSPRDVLLVAGSASPGTVEPLYGRVLIATDGSSTADRAARKGFELAETLETPVTIVFVGHPKTGELVTQDTIATYAGEVKTDVLLREGDPATQILAAADEVDAGLIVVGNKGMVGAKGFLMGSVPQEVCERATRDVLIARTVTQIVSELSAGEGGIVERAGEKLAVYVDHDAAPHVMSARCTHMGCTVKWNPAERTFDCPCHGSRFGPTGDVVNGPAARPLPPA